jgi:hydrogenase maturation factor
MIKIKGIIDRFEGNIAVVEIDGVTKNFNKDIFPKDATTGDVVEIDGDSVTVLNDETEKLRKEIEELMNDVWED